MRSCRSALFCFLALGASEAHADRKRYLWVANSNEGTVSKLDAATGVEVARYATLSHDVGVLVNHVNRAIAPWGAAHNPRSVAVDFYGNAWVTNRPTAQQPSATKIMNDEPNCFDRNGSATIDTSREVNGTPGIQIADPLEFFGEADECIKLTIVVGDVGGNPRALAIDRGVDVDDGGNPWIGFANELAFYQIDGESGQILRRVPPAGASSNSPFSAAIDRNGVLWATHGCCAAAPRLWQIDTLTGAESTTGTATSFSCDGSFGIAIGPDDKPWLAGYPCPWAAVYDPGDTSWTEVAVPGYSGWATRGIGADRYGNLWLSMTKNDLTDAAVVRIDAGTETSTGSFDNGGVNSYGVAVGFDGDVFTVDAGVDDVSRLHIDPLTLQPAPHPGTGNVVDLFPVGDVQESNGDFTGLAMETVVRPYPEGHPFSDGFYSGGTGSWSTATP